MLFYLNVEQKCGLTPVTSQNHTFYDNKKQKHSNYIIPDIIKHHTKKLLPLR